MKRAPNTQQTGGKEDSRVSLNVVVGGKKQTLLEINLCIPRSSFTELFRIFNVKYTVNLSSSMCHTFSVIEKTVS
jgi:hypothetical protein